jgi:hypothetical protein
MAPSMEGRSMTLVLAPDKAVVKKTDASQETVKPDAPEKKEIEKPVQAKETEKTE